MLPNNDVAGTTRLAAEQFDAETLARRIATIPGRSACLLVRHGNLPSRSPLAQFHDGFVAHSQRSRGSCMSHRRIRRSCLSFRCRLTPWPRRWCLRRLAALGQYLGDSNQGEFLSMPAFAPRILAAALFEGDDLWAPHMI